MVGYICQGLRPCKIKSNHATLVDFEIMKASQKQIEYCRQLVKDAKYKGKVDFVNLSAAEAHKLIREINNQLKRHGWSWRGKLNLVFGAKK